MVLNTDDLVKVEFEAAELKEQLGCVVDRVAVCDEGQIFRKRRELTHNVPHGYDRIHGISVGENLIRSDYLCGRVREEEYIVILPAYMNICLVTALSMRQLIWIVINHIFEKCRDTLCVVADSLM